MAGLAIGPPELLRARPDPHLVEPRCLGEGQLLAELRLLERVPADELDDRLRALDDLQGDVDAVEGGIVGRLTGSDAGFEEALLVQLILEGAQPLAIGTLAEHVALAEAPGLGLRLGLCLSEPVD